MKTWEPKTPEEKQWAKKLLESAENSIEHKVAVYLKKVLHNKEEEYAKDSVQSETR